VSGALATTDAEGSEGSEAGVAKLLAGGVVVEEGAASCGCLEQAASVKSNADDTTNGADFMSWLSKPRRYSYAVSTQYLPPGAGGQLPAKTRRW
jgi:hypothetical protein